MDNKTTAKHMESLIRKWDRIRRLVLEKKDRDYVSDYWNSCGYCVVFKRSPFWGDCNQCPLYLGRSRKYGMPYCYAYMSKPSVVSRALELADSGHWARALQHVDCLLAKMRRYLRKAVAVMP